MSAALLHAQHRDGTGKTVTRKIRAEGRIPAVVYGKGGDPVTVSLDPAELVKTLDPEKKSNTVITLQVDSGNGKTEDILVMLRDWQTDAMRGDVSHADFVRVRLDQDVHATVPLLFTGKAEGVKNGGTLHLVYRSLEIACTPDKIPTKIEVNVDKLGMGDALHVRELVLGPGVRALVDAGQTVCVVTAPRAERAAAATTDAAAEGAEAKPGEAKADAKKGDAKKADAKKPDAKKADAKKAAPAKK